MPQSPESRPGRGRHSTEEGRIPEQPRAGHRRTGPREEDAARGGGVARMAPRRDAGSLPGLHTTPEDRRDASEATTTVQVRQVGRLHGEPPRLSRGGTDRERRRQCAGRTHPEPLANRKVMREPETEATLSMSQQSTGDVLRYRQRSAHIGLDADRRLSRRRPLSYGLDAGIENNTRPDRASTTRVPGLERRGEDSRHVGRCERPADASWGFGCHRRPTSGPALKGGVTKGSSRSLRAETPSSGVEVVRANAKWYNPRQARTHWSLLGDVEPEPDVGYRTGVAER